MTVIPIKNGTTSITITCSPLSSLMYDADDNAYVCIYSDWGYGLFAIIAAIGLFVPIALIIYCGVKCHNKMKEHHNYPSNYSRQSSQSSLYPSSGRDLSVFPNEDVDYLVGGKPSKRKSKRVRDKLYYPYAAYGTYDGPSLGGSTGSLAAPPIPPEVAVASPSYIPQTPSISHRHAIYVSNSAPVIDTKLRDYREKLYQNIATNPMGKTDIRRSLKSLDSFEQNSSQSLYQGPTMHDNSLKSIQSKASFTANSVSTSSDGSLLYPEETAQKRYASKTKKISANRNSLKDNKPKTDLKNPFSKNVLTQASKNIPNSNKNAESNNIFESEPSTINCEQTEKSNDSSVNDCIQAPSVKDTLQRCDSIDSLAGERSGSIKSHGEKNHVLAATPTKNMTTRQDFDNYLVECVLKLPEDQRNGTFLIRDSSSVDSCKVLTLYCKSTENNAKLYYYKINNTDDGYFQLETTSLQFETMDDLITCHKKNCSVLPCLLGDCLGKHF